MYLNRKNKAHIKQNYHLAKIKSINLDLVNPDSPVFTITIDAILFSIFFDCFFDFGGTLLVAYSILS